MGQSRLDERPHLQDTERDARKQDRREEDIGDHVAEAHDLPARHDTKRPIEPAHVPVRLHGIAHLVRHVRAVEPNGVDLEERAEDARDRDRQEHETGRFRNEGGPQRRPDNVPGRVAASGELRVFLADEHSEVSAE